MKLLNSLSKLSYTNLIPKAKNSLWTFKIMVTHITNIDLTD